MDQALRTLPFPQGKTQGLVDSIPRSTAERLLAVLDDIAGSLRILAAAHAPRPGELVGSPYVAKRLGITTVYVAQMARDGKIPKNCILAGTGDGKVWKFHRDRIDRWIDEGRPQP
jgi:hypothetical protein